MMYPKSLEAGSAVVRAYAPWQGGPVFRREQQEQARRAFPARARKRDHMNLKSSEALEAKALVGDGAGFPAALAAVTATLRTMAKHSEDFIAAIEQEFRLHSRVASYRRRRFVVFHPRTGEARNPEHRGRMQISRVKSSQFNTLPKAKRKTRSKQNKDMHKFSSVYSERGVPLPVLTSGGE